MTDLMQTESALGLDLKNVSGSGGSQRPAVYALESRLGRKSVIDVKLNSR